MTGNQLEFIDLLISGMGKANIASAQVYAKKISTLEIVVNSNYQDTEQQEKTVIVAEGCFNSYFTRLVLHEYDVSLLKTYIETLIQTALEDKIIYANTIIQESIINRVQLNAFKNSHIEKALQNIIVQEINKNLMISRIEITYTKQTTTIFIKNINNKKMQDGCIFQTFKVVVNGQDNSAVVCEYGHDLSNLEGIVLRAIEKLKMQLNAQSLEAGFYTTVFSGSVIANLLAQYVPLFLADREESLVEKKGYLFCDSRISIVDKQNFPQGQYMRVFDDIGVATMETNVVERGLFCDALQTQKTAVEFRVQSTGNNFYNSTYTQLIALPTNLVVSTGTSELNSILRKLNMGVYINEMDIANSTFCNQTGDFTMTVSGCMYENKTTGKGILPVTIVSNIYDLLKNVESIGDLLDFSNCNEYFVAAPCLKIKKVAFI
ncbi:MAG: metallopeptidase TldD-related protein [Oscillospiraceae bacterium]